ncbi:MAG: ChbG/HpnK family deacetylase [Bacteroidota bacterium]
MAPRGARAPMTSPEARLIVTADDLGLQGDVDAGIVRAASGGIVTHASWLAGGESADAAPGLVAREAPDLGVGLHLSLSQTRPSGDPRPLAGLLRPDGRFPDRQFAAIRWAWRRQRLGAIWDEWRAQADAFERAWGRTPTHLDSHQHVHLAPMLGPLAVRLAVERWIPRLRAPVGPARGLEARVFVALGARLRRRARSAGLTVPDRFDGFEHSGRLDRQKLSDMSAALGPGLTEWMAHPGMTDEPSGYARRQEMEALLAV